MTGGQQLAECLPTVGRMLTNSRPTVFWGSCSLNYFPLIMVSVKLKHDIIVLICCYFILLPWHYFTKYSIRFVKWDWQLLKKEQISKELLTCHFTSLWPVNLYIATRSHDILQINCQHGIRPRFVTYIHTYIHQNCRQNCLMSMVLAPYETVLYSNKTMITRETWTSVKL